MAHVQHQQAADGSVLAVQSPGVVKLDPAPLKRRTLSRHGSLQPQENDDDDSDTTGQSDTTVDSEKETQRGKPRRLSDRCQLKKSLRDDDASHEHHCATTLLPELELLCVLTRRIEVRLDRDQWTQQELEDDEDQDDDEYSQNDAEPLASLYCQRAKTLLQYANYDSSVRIPLALLESLDPQLVQSDSGLSIAPEGWCAVKQALDDALAAVACDAQANDAYFVAAQCARSLGDATAAIEYVGCALRQTPQRKKLHTLMRQLLRETKSACYVIAPPLLCRSTQATDEADAQQQQDEDDDSADDFALELKARFRLMETLGDSPLLRSLEPMMHEALHHQCATSDESLALAAAMNETVAFLRMLLEDTETTSRAVLLETHQLLDTAKLLTNGKRLVDSPHLRRWTFKTLASAVVQSLPDGLLEGTVVSSSVSCRAAILRDVLLMLARLLHTMGNLQRCTNMPHALATSKMAYDLTKQLATDPATQDKFLPLELACKDAYALALLDLAEEAGEALLLHQQTLDKAIEQQDRERELRSRHMLGRALFHIREYDAARTEFTTLLQHSEALGDCAMACLATYLLGECQIAVGDLDEGMRLLERAMLLCHQTDHCHRTWRKDSIQRAIAFYSCLLRPVRRLAVVRRSSLTKPRKATLVVATPTMMQQDSAYWAWEEQQHEKKEEEEELTTRRRRAAVWMTNTLEANSAEVETPRRSLAETVIGGYSGGETSETKTQKEEEEERQEREREEEEERGPLTTYGVSLTSWLIGQSTTSPTRPECCKPVE